MANTALVRTEQRLLVKVRGYLPPHNFTVRQKSIKKGPIVMSITRIFRVRVPADLRREFEAKFSIVSIQAVNKTAGYISSSILKPTKWTPDEYSMISCWENEDALIAFAGKNWNRAIIPSGMERFVIECWLHHYESWPEA